MNQVYFAEGLRQETALFLRVVQQLPNEQQMDVLLRVQGILANTLGLTLVQPTVMATLQLELEAAADAVIAAADFLQYGT